MLPGRAKLAEAMRYALSRWDTLTLASMTVALSSIRTLLSVRSAPPRSVARTTFCRKDGGGARWAVLCSLIETCKLNGVELLAGLPLRRFTRWSMDILSTASTSYCHGLESRKPVKEWRWCASSGRLPFHLSSLGHHLGFCSNCQVVDPRRDRSHDIEIEPFLLENDGSLSSESASRSSITAREVGEITPPKIEKRSSIRLKCERQSQKYCSQNPRIGRIFFWRRSPFSSPPFLSKRRK